MLFGNSEINAIFWEIQGIHQLTISIQGKMTSGTL